MFCGGERGLRLLLSQWCLPRCRLGAVNEELVPKLAITVFAEKSRTLEVGLYAKQMALPAAGVKHY